MSGRAIGRAAPLGAGVGVVVTAGFHLAVSAALGAGGAFVITRCDAFPGFTFFTGAALDRYPLKTRFSVQSAIFISRAGSAGFLANGAFVLAFGLTSAESRRFYPIIADISPGAFFRITPGVASVGTFNAIVVIHVVSAFGRAGRADAGAGWYYFPAVSTAACSDTFIAGTAVVIKTAGSASGNATGVKNANGNCEYRQRDYRCL